MKHYLIKKNIDWADEFDIPVVELFDEDKKEKYLKLIADIKDAIEKRKNGEWVRPKFKYYSDWEKEWIYAEKDAPHIGGYVFFGTNEGWEDEEWSPFNILEIEKMINKATEIPEDDYNVLVNYTDGITMVDPFDVVEDLWSEIFVDAEYDEIAISEEEFNEHKSKG